MKAAFRTKYGLPGDLSIKELDIPVPKENEILIRVHAATVNRSDCHVLSGKPFVMRLFTGLTKPKASVIGTDFAGEIAAVGSAVQSFKVDDKVMGFGGAFGCGAQAQYFILPEAKAQKAMVTMPAGISYEDAAACLEGVVYASAMIRAFKPRPGQKALVYGASGAIGVAYVQLLKYYDLYVTAVCRGEQAGLINSIGADKVVDYTKEDFTKDKERYDYVLDAVGKSSFFKCKKLMKKTGVYASSGGAINLLLVPLTKLFGGRKVAFPAPGSIIPALQLVKEMLEHKKFKPVIDKIVPLKEIADAYRYVASGKKVGNVVVSMG